MMFALFIYNYRYTLQESFLSAQEETDSGRIGRFSAWNAARMMIKESPLIGIGRGNFVQYWQANYEPGVYGYQVAHNIMYQVTSEIGFAGLLCFLFFSLAGILEYRSMKKIFGLQLEKNAFIDMICMIYVIGLIGFFINGMFITVAFYWHIYVLVALFVAAKNIFMKEVKHAQDPVQK
nr:O-antigen ligase family protein [Candidatus Omnitrophota bacterium]